MNFPPALITLILFVLLLPFLPRLFGWLIGILIGLFIVAVTRYKTFTLIVLLIVAVPGLIIIATPFVLFGGSLYYWIKFKKNYNNLKGNESDFWLSDDERKNFAQLSATHEQAWKNIKTAEEQKNRRKDRAQTETDDSPRETVLELDETIVSNRKSIKSIEDTLETYFYHLPQKRWVQFSNVIMRAHAFDRGCLCWVSGAIVFIWIYADTFFIGIETFINFVGVETLIKFTPFLLDNTLAKNDWIMLLGTTACGIVGYFVFRYMAKGIPAKFTPWPPQVSIKNYNSWQPDPLR